MSYVRPSFRTHPRLHCLYMYIAGKCNLHCKHCWLDPEPAEGEAREGEGYLPYDLFLKALDEATPLGLRGVKYTGGEPLLHPRLADMLREGKSRGLSQMVETNGTLITPKLAKVMAECADRVSVSIDGATAETHDSFRGMSGAFERCKEGIRSLSRAGVPGSNIEVICTMREEAIGERDELIRLASQAGAGGVKYNLLQRIGRARAERDHAGVEGILEASRLLEGARVPGTAVYVDIPPAFRTISSLLKGTFSCRALNLMGVLWDGTLALCGIGKHEAGLCFGNLATGSATGVWLRDQVLMRLRKGLPSALEGICGSCVHSSACRGKCIAANYARTGRLLSPFWMCEEAYGEGMFPSTRMKRGGNTMEVKNGQFSRTQA